MPENLHLVFSKAPEAISDKTFNQWCDSSLDATAIGERVPAPTR